jgi:GAF domain-containing protein
MLEQVPDGAEQQTGVHPGLMTVAEQVTAEDDDGDLTESLFALSTLSVARLSLEDLLTQVASFAVHAIPGADGAGLTLLEHDHPDTVVTSEEFVRQVEKIQYGINEGPCITAAATRETVRSGSLTADPRWPRFGPRVGRLGVHSVLSLPLLTDEVVVGAMNVYAHTRDAFDDRAERIGQLFAVPAAIAVQNAQMLAQTQRLTANLQRAMINRAVIDQAIGIIISRAGITPEEAFDRLRTLSQKEHIKVSAVAASIVDAAGRRARDRAQRE